MKPPILRWKERDDLSPNQMKFLKIVMFLERSASRTAHIPANSPDVLDVARAIDLMKNNPEPHDPDMIIVHPWTYEWLELMGFVE